LEADEDVQTNLVEILDLFPDLIDRNSDQEQADPYLIGLAMKLKATVITEEEIMDPAAVQDPNRKKKMKIPNVCRHFGLATMNLVQFVNSSEWRTKQIGKN